MRHGYPVGVKAVKGIHFGMFLRSQRVARGWTVKVMAEKVEVTQPRIIAYEKSPTPEMYESTYGQIAKVLGMSPEQMTTAWQTTEVVLADERKNEARKRKKLAGFLQAIAKHNDAADIIELLDPATIQRLRELLSLAPAGAHFGDGRLSPPKAQQRRPS